MMIALITKNQLYIMKSKYLKIIIIMVISIISIFIFFIINQSKNKLKLNTERKIQKTLILDNSIKLDKRLSVMKLYQNRLFFVSWTKDNQGKIFRFNLSNNKFEKEINFNKIGGKLLIETYFIENDSIIFYNQLNNSMVFSDFNAKKINEVIYPKRFSRLIKFEDNVLFSGWDKNYNIFFENYNIKSKEIQPNKFEDDYFSKYENSGISLDGFYYKNSNHVIMLPYAINRVYTFDKHLKYNGKIDLIYGELDFKFRKSEKADLFIDPSNLSPNIAGYIDDNDKLYILTDHSTKWDKSNKCFIDIYNLNTKKYEKSLKIDDYNNSKPRFIAIDNLNNKLYVLFDENLNSYKL